MVKEEQRGWNPSPETVVVGRGVREGGCQHSWGVVALAADGKCQCSWRNKALFINRKCQGVGCV